MNTGTLVITTVLVIIVMLPFILMAIGRRRKKQQLLQLIRTLPEAQGRSLIDIEYCGDILICWDADKRYLFFAKHTKDLKQSSKCIELNTVVRCEPFKQSRNLKDDGGSHTVIDKLELQFFGLASVEKCVKLTFYNADKNLLPTTELEVMNRWADMINAEVGYHRKKGKLMANRE